LREEALLWLEAAELAKLEIAEQSAAMGLTDSELKETLFPSLAGHPEFEAIVAEVKNRLEKE